MNFVYFKNVKPKHKLTAKQMDELVEFEIFSFDTDFDNLDVPREEP